MLEESRYGKAERQIEYDYWLHWYLSDRCVMGCDYCGGLEHTVKMRAPVTTIDVPNLLRTLNGTGKVFLVGFTGGGEPFLSPNLGEACLALTERHFVRFNTDLVEKGIAPFLRDVDPARVAMVHASCHIKALERRKLLDRFIENYLLCKERGIPVFAEEIGYPPLFPEVDTYRKLFADRGVELLFAPFRGVYEGKHYPASYTDEERKLLDFEDERVSAHTTSMRRRRFYCNAGYNVAVVRSNGDVFPCDHIQESIGNVYRGINFQKRLSICPIANCMCPLHAYDKTLYERAVREQRLVTMGREALHLPGDVLRKCRNIIGRTRSGGARSA